MLRSAQQPAKSNSATNKPARVLWRGMKDMDIGPELLKHGGTELACMSTSEDRSVAAQFSGLADRKVKWPLIMKVQVLDFMSSGVDISWLSAFPEEKEFLYPPLTFLRIVTTAKRAGVTMALVSPSYPT